MKISTTKDLTRNEDSSKEIHLGLEEQEIKFKATETKVKSRKKSTSIIVNKLNNKTKSTILQPITSKRQEKQKTAVNNMIQEVFACKMCCLCKPHRVSLRKHR